jgi:hypothetical protein
LFVVTVVADDPVPFSDAIRVAFPTVINKSTDPVPEEISCPSALATVTTTLIDPSAATPIIP